MTEEENNLNMRHCPRFESCSIPKCPLDYFMNERVELPDDKKCILIAGRGKRVDGNVRGHLKRIVGKYAWLKNRSANIPLPTPIRGIKGDSG